MNNSAVQQPKWKKREYSRSQITNAGKILRNPEAANEEIAEAVKVVDNWRASHAFPLHVIYMHLRRMRGSRNDIIVAERLKRLDSITSKLKREPRMNLWTMQDLGGCRVVVPSIQSVYMFAEKFEKSRKRHIKKETYDYIKTPKTSGYRSLHVVYEYHSDKSNEYNRNMLIEIQFRTHLQHLWATAVETMGLFTKEAIKSGQGSESVKRFFVLTSALFSTIEKQPIVSGVPEDMDSILHEISELDKQNNYLAFLSGIRVAIDNQDQKSSIHKSGYCILILNYNTRRLSLRFFNASQIEYANATYNSIERTRDKSKIDAVLVRVSSFKELRSAYPNYFSDIQEFIDIIAGYLKCKKNL